MKKVIISFVVVLCIFSLFSSVFATSTDVLNELEISNSKLVEFKEEELKEIEDYNQRYGSEAYGWTAYILNKVRIYSIPLCFLGVAIGAIYQYVIGIRKLDERDRGFGMIVTVVTIFGICQLLPLIFAIVVKGWRS